MNYDSRRWIVLVACALASVCAGSAYAWSVVLKPMMSTFGWTASQVSMSFTAMIAVACTSALIAGKALQYVQPRTLLLIGGAVMGAGYVCLGSTQSIAELYFFAMLVGLGGLVYPGATMTNLMTFFADRRGLAAGVLTGSFGLGAILWAPVTVFLIDELGLRWALRTLGVLFFLIIAVCSRLVTTAPEGYRPPERAHEGRIRHQVPAMYDIDWRHMLKTPSFWALALVFTIGATAGLMMTGHASPIAQAVLGISPTAAGLVVSILAAGMVIGKIMWGAASDRVGRYPVLAAQPFLTTIGLLLIWRTSTYAPVVLGFCIVGTCYGCFLALIGPVTNETFGSSHFPINFGLMYLSIGVASYVGPRLAAGVAEADNGDYTWAFIIAAMISGVGLVVLVLCWLLSRRATQTTTAVSVDYASD
jgi:MFS transporter, OFA family, oxalate/formate antiporter